MSGFITTQRSRKVVGKSSISLDVTIWTVAQTKAIYQYFFGNYDNSRTKVIEKEELLENDGMSVLYSV